jgi:hypothetical protein
MLFLYPRKLIIESKQGGPEGGSTSENTIILSIRLSLYEGLLILEPPAPLHDVLALVLGAVDDLILDVSKVIFLPIDFKCNKLFGEVSSCSFCRSKNLE